MQSENARGSGDITTTVRSALGTIDVSLTAHIHSIDSDEEAGVFAEEPVVAASVFKVAVALEFSRQVSAGELDPLDRVGMTAAARTPGPTGLSLFKDDVVVSLRDLATSMMVVSDNAATDILLARVTIERVNETLKRLGATGTHIASDVAALLATTASEAGLRTWDDVLREDPFYERLQDSRALQPETTTRTTARDMTQLLRAIWTDTAGPADACANVRRLMACRREAASRTAFRALRSLRRVAACSASSETRSAWQSSRTVSAMPSASSPAPLERISTLRQRSTRRSGV